MYSHMYYVSGYTILAWIINIYHENKEINNKFIIASREYFLHTATLEAFLSFPVWPIKAQYEFP